MSDDMSRVEQLMAPMLKLELFVIFWHGKGHDLRPVLAEHLQYMIDLERDGKLFASGPLGPREKGNGMTIVRADTQQDATEVAKGDPFVAHGLRDFIIEPWTIMEGRIGLALNFSDSSITLS